jgi:hypothetical protein
MDQGDCAGVRPRELRGCGPLARTTRAARDSVPGFTFWKRECGGDGDCLFHVVSEGMRQIAALSRRGGRGQSSSGHSSGDSSGDRWATPTTRQVKAVSLGKLREKTAQQFLQFVVDELRAETAGIPRDDWRPRVSQIVGAASPLLSLDDVSAVEPWGEATLAVWGFRAPDSRGARAPTAHLMAEKDLERLRRVLEAGFLGAHWGNETDFSAISKAFNVGLIPITSHGTVVCPFYLEQHNFDFPFYIFVYSETDHHFQLGALVPAGVRGGCAAEEEVAQSVFSGSTLPLGYRRLHARLCPQKPIASSRSRNFTGVSAAW